MTHVFYITLYIQFDEGTFDVEKIRSNLWILLYYSSFCNRIHTHVTHYVLWTFFLCEVHENLKKWQSTETTTKTMIITNKNNCSNCFALCHVTRKSKQTADCRVRLIVIRQSLMWTPSGWAVVVWTAQSCELWSREFGRRQWLSIHWQIPR